MSDRKEQVWSLLVCRCMRLADYLLPHSPERLSEILYEKKSIGNSYEAILALHERVEELEVAVRNYQLRY